MGLQRVGHDWATELNWVDIGEIHDACHSQNSKLRKEYDLEGEEKGGYKYLFWDIYTVQAFSGGSVVKNLPANAEDMSLIPGLGRFPGEGNGNPLQYSCLGNPIDRGAWQATVHGFPNKLDKEQLNNNNNTI